MPSKKRKFGDLGEKIAEQYLLKNGYFILEKNFQTKMGELDIIAFKPQNKISHNINREIGKFFANNKEIGKNNREIIGKNGLIAFIEVKSSAMNNTQNVSRETPPFSQKKRGKPFDRIRPEENVHFKKQKHLVKSAQNYLAYKKFPLDINWQIDVIAIDIDEISHKANLRHIKQAVTFF
ncbi:MAG: hypothetical protein US76_00830 [Parcubacteria group bacterium GW2011_GWA2_38_13b]|nr:MAG: hypothetical protein US76_00830 [Parcubacteria group bacterium GW2011_GWA2_38_13b]